MIGVFLRRLGLGVFRSTGPGVAPPPPSVGLLVYGAATTVQTQTITIQGQ